ncbi:MAG: restriction endonuclease subunit S [Latilactobacillus curvatus]
MSKIRDHQSTQPAIRFKGFTDAWEKRRLSEIVTEHNSGVYIAKDEYGSGTNIIGVGDIYESDLVDGQVFRLAPVKDEKFILHSRDLLYGESSLVQEGIARVVSVTEKGAGTAFAWHTRRFVVEPAVADSQFVMLELNYWFPAREHLMRTATKTALTGITTQDFFSTNILVPILFEQKKICDLVHRLDNLITVNQRKGDVLQNFKKALLQRLFASETSPIPDIRFKGFTDAWEKRKLGEVVDIKCGGTPSTSRPEYWNGGIDWYAPAEIGTQRYVYKSRRRITELGLEKSSAVMLPANKTILFTSRAGIGNAAILTSAATTNQGFQSMIVNSNTDTYFLYSKIPEIKHKAIRVAAGSTFLEISGKSLSKIPIKLPEFEEQVKIGRLFLKIDNLIAATQRKGEVLKNLKKALLQKMFV